MSPITTTEIATYAANIVSPGDPNEFAATVVLFQADGNMIAFLRFYRSGMALPANEFRQDLYAAVVSLSYDALSPIIDLLRNEKPVYFTWFDYSAAVPGRTFAAIGTSREPIGEHE